MLLLKDFVQCPAWKKPKNDIMVDVNFMPACIEDAEEVMSLVKEAKIFVVTQEQDTLEQKREGPVWSKDGLDVPFSVCWVEYRDAVSFQSILTELPRYSGIGLNMLGVLVREIRPKCYDFYLYCSVEYDQSNYRNTTDVIICRNVDMASEEVAHSPVSDNMFTVFCLHFLYDWLAKIDSRNVTVENINDLKIRLSDSKVSNGSRPYSIKKIIHLHPNYLKENLKTISTRGQIDWSHRFEVRGHWRRVPTIGKNREGVYDVAGFTWVSAHVRGPEDAALISKIRVVHE